jgi:inosine-uridine nucleoside N-ribohydrolase
MNNGVAEYNVHTDPEAAHLVFKVLSKKLIIIPYEGVISVSEFTVKYLYIIRSLKCLNKIIL